MGWDRATQGLRGFRYRNRIGKVRLAPGTGCRSAQSVLKVADATGNVGRRCQFGEAIIIVRGASSTHECPLMLGVLMVQVHVSSPAVAGMLVHGRE
tara:strand:+ start:90 stop:377 length:288 start_codon:yes stop_codon:yes gene_type:complete